MSRQSQLEQQVHKIFSEHNHEHSIATRWRYEDGATRFADFVAENFGLQKISNVSAKHVFAYFEQMKSKGISPATMRTDLSGIRFMQEKSGSHNKLPDNRAFDLPKRSVGVVDRAWMAPEIEKGTQLAKDMGREDVNHAIMLSSQFGLRIEGCANLRCYQITDALKTGELHIERGQEKNGKERWIPITMPSQRETLQEINAHMRDAGRHGGDRVCVQDVHQKVGQTIRSLQDWMGNHRGKIQERGDNPAFRKYQERATEAGVKLRTDSLSFHGLRYTYAQNRYAELIRDGKTPAYARKEVSLCLGHNREAITKIYLAEK